MNLFQKYGIKEVADVVFYSINEIGDEVFYTPVLFLDTLKVSTLEKTASKVSAQGGYGNKKLITWNFGKEITLNLEDALFSPASMSMIWGGKLQSELSAYTGSIVKCNMANKYGKLHYSIKAYPSPAMTDDEWEVIFAAAQGVHLSSGSGNAKDNIYVHTATDDDAYVEDNRTNLIKNYFKRTIDVEDLDGQYKGAMPTEVIEAVMAKIDTIEKLGTIKTDIHDLEVIDRMEKCIVNNKDGLTISTTKQRENLFRYYADDRTSSYTIFYDAKTMLPLLPVDKKTGFIGKPKEIQTQELLKTHPFSIEEKTLPLNVKAKIPKKEAKETEEQYVNRLNEAKIPVSSIWNDFYGLKQAIYSEVKTAKSSVSDIEILSVKNAEGTYITFVADTTTSYRMNIQNIVVRYREIEQEDLFKIKIGTVYYKWTRTVKYKESDDDGILGKTLVIDADTFPGAYKIVGETYIREQKTQRDQRYQFTIYRANVSSDTNITLEAEGDPTTFSMSIDVLTPPNDIMMELRQIDVEDDKIEGGTRIVPQSSKYSYTPTAIEMKETVDIENNEIY